MGNNPDDHPTLQSLILTAGSGSFRMEDSEINYIQLALWVGHLGLGYGLARVHLSQVLGGEGDIMSRVTLVAGKFAE